MKIKAAVQAAWSKSTSVKHTGKLTFKGILKRPIFLGFVGVILIAIVSSGGYVYHQRHIDYLHASLRDSCQASELFIGVRGSGETSDQVAGLGVPVGDTEHKFSADMQPAQIAGEAVDYEAVRVDHILTWSMYDASWAQGVQQLDNSLYYWNHHCPNYRFVVAGYSQGADVVGRVVATLNPSNPTEQQIINKIDGVALFGDPKYNPNQRSIDAISSSARPGLFSTWPTNHPGPRADYPSYFNGRIRSWCRNGDPICQVTDSCKAYGFAPSAELWGACSLSVGNHISQHTSYTSGQTAEAAAWLADKARHPSNPPVAASPSPTSPNPQPPSPKPSPSPRPVAPAPKQTNTSKAAPTTPQSTVNKYNVPPLASAPTPAAAPPPNRVAVTSYDRMQAGAPHHAYFDVAWQNFVAQSNTITYLSATVGSPGGNAGVLAGVPLTIRLCTSPSCGTILAQTSPQIVNYGETGSDIGDVSVTPGATYYIVYYQPAPLNGNTWVTYWWTGGSSIGSSDQMQAVARGYNK